MAELADAVPKDIFGSMFSGVREEVNASTWKEFQKTCAKDVPSVCMFIWDEMAHRGVAAEPFKIGPIVNNGFRGIARFVEQELGESPVVDAFAVSYFNDIDLDHSFVDVDLVQCWPNDIHIADVEFSDNRKPIRVGATARKAANRSYHGLHVFGVFIERLKKIAQARDLERISLIVAHADLYPVFKRHGFEVSETDMAQLAFKGPGVGFPMILRV